jgi:hypothetical protein
VPAEHTDQSPAGHASVSLGNRESWEIVTHADGNVFLVGPNETAQIDPALVNDLISRCISPPHVLEIAAQASMAGEIAEGGVDAALTTNLALEQSSHAGPSGLTTMEKDDAAAPHARITEVTDGEDTFPSGRDKGQGKGKGKGKAKASTLYDRHYLDQYGGIEPAEDEAYVGAELTEDFESVEVSDEEMELEQED